MTFARGSCHRLVVTAQPSAALLIPSPEPAATRPSRMPTVLLIDDNDGRAHGPRRPAVAARHAASLRSFVAAPRACTCWRNRAVDLVIQDMNFRREATSGEEGVALFHRIRERASRPAGHPAHGVDAPGNRRRPGQGRRRRLRRQALGRRAAADHGAQPAGAARRASRTRASRRAARRSARAARRSASTCAAWCTKARRCTTLASTARQVAHADVPVLITGPNGAGKEVLADIVQANSARQDRPLREGQRRRAADTADRGRAVRRRGGRLHGRQGARRAASRPPTAARCSSTRSATCRSPARRNCCACCRPANSSASARTRRVAPTCA